MVEVSGRAMVFMIQLVDERMWMLKAKIDRAPPHDAKLPGMEDELVKCGVVAAELRDSYERALKSAATPPPQGLPGRYRTGGAPQRSGRR